MKMRRVMLTRGRYRSARAAKKLRCEEIFSQKQLLASASHQSYFSESCPPKHTSIKNVGKYVVRTFYLDGVVQCYWRADHLLFVVFLCDHFSGW